MKVYRVGGAVRDLIAGNDVDIQDVDYVVVGGSREEMLAAGYQQVGLSFPVFLNEKGEEHALARRERKVGPGYTGFEFDVEDISLHDDLARRDLTINAIAMRCDKHPLDDGEWELGEDVIIDPFNGISDIRNCVLRHIDAEAFAEDPVRVLRVARFLARFPQYIVAKETTLLLKGMVAAGCLEELVAERVGMELEKALKSESPSRFFIYLQAIGALEVLFPEIHALIGKTQPYEHHPEGDAFVHTMLVLDECSIYTNELPTRFAALAHDFGKGTSPIEHLPHHYGHEDRGVPIVKSFCKRLRLSNECMRLGMFVAKWHTHVHRTFDMKPTSFVAKMYDKSEWFKNLKWVEALCLVAQADAAGRGPFYLNVPYNQAAAMCEVMEAINKVNLRDLLTTDQIVLTPISKRKHILSAARMKAAKAALDKHRVGVELGELDVPYHQHT